MKPPTSPTSETLLRERLDRRALLRGAATGATALALAGGEALAAANQPARLTASLPPSNADALLLAPGYRHDVVIRWGEALWRGGESLEPRLLAGPLLTRADAAMKQERQFGTNCDAIASFPLAAGRRIVISNALPAMPSRARPLRNGSTGGSTGVDARRHYGPDPPASRVDPAGCTPVTPSLPA